MKLISIAIALLLSAGCATSPTRDIVDYAPFPKWWPPEYTVDIVIDQPNADEAVGLIRDQVFRLGRTDPGPVVMSYFSNSNAVRIILVPTTNAAAFLQTIIGFEFTEVAPLIFKAKRTAHNTPDIRH